MEKKRPAQSRKPRVLPRDPKVELGSPESIRDDLRQVRMQRACLRNAQMDDLKGLAALYEDVTGEEPTLERLRDELWELTRYLVERWKVSPEYQEAIGALAVESILMDDAPTWGKMLNIRQELGKTVHASKDSVADWEDKLFLAVGNEAAPHLKEWARQQVKYPPVFFEAMKLATNAGLGLALDYWQAVQGHDVGYRRSAPSKLTRRKVLESFAIALYHRTYLDYRAPYLNGEWMKTDYDHFALDIALDSVLREPLTPIQRYALRKVIVQLNGQSDPTGRFVKLLLARGPEAELKSVFDEWCSWIQLCDATCWNEPDEARKLCPAHRSDQRLRYLIPFQAAGLATTNG